MPWLGYAPDAPDSHKMWADPGTTYEAALKASGWCHVVPAPGSDTPVNEPPADPVPVNLEQPVEQKPRRRRTQRKP